MKQKRETKREGREKLWRKGKKRREKKEHKEQAKE